ncbi:MAG: Fic family protein [Bifidobacteriaceae bacterium]|nr:Fic family protein [Bifidobacteriaceae bacterium]
MSVDLSGHEPPGADGSAVREALQEERAMGLKGGIYHLTQITLAYNSNRIEGSRLSPEQTRYIYETQSVTGDAPVDDVIETSNHFRLFDQMLNGVGSPLTAERILAYHATLKAGTSDAAKPWFAVGGWKRRPNFVGDRSTVPPEMVGSAVDALLAAFPPDRPMRFDDICDFHYRFEAIHPFQDGNGRVGRIVAFEQCLRYGIVPFIVLDAEKLYYYRGLAEYEAEPGFLRDTLRHFQDQYQRAVAEYLTTAENPDG